MSIPLIAACADALVIASTVLLGRRLARVREARGPHRLTRERRELEQLLREAPTETPSFWDLRSAAAAPRTRTGPAPLKS
jgi:hypothetical protein